MPVMTLPLVAWVKTGELFFLMLANSEGASCCCRWAPRHETPRNNLATFEHSNFEHNLKSSRVLGQFSSANALEELDDRNSFRNASQVQTPSVPNANGQMFQGNGSNTSNRYVINENEA
jgi:hypothetical protein